MEIDITSFFENQEPFEFSASIAERGKNAGKETWANAKQLGEDAPLLTTEEQLEALRLYVKDFGAWSAEEIAAWSPIECNALFIQLISGDMREGGLDGVDLEDEDWREYEKGAEEGRYAGNIFKAEDGTIYYSLSR